MAHALGPFTPAPPQAARLTPNAELTLAARFRGPPPTALRKFLYRFYNRRSTRITWPRGAAVLVHVVAGQAFSNVIHNAVKYTDPGGEIHVEVLDSDAEVRINVQDNGTGIAPALLPHLFDLFVQSERTLDRSQGGLGIGLSVVKRLIEMHGGSVQAASPGVGRGSTFTLRLPRIAPPDAEARVPAAGRVLPRRVLVVDDNVDAADSLAMVLAFDGHEAHAVYGALEALEAVARLQPEVIFLDIGLPDMDGYEVARQLKARHGQMPLRLIALTGYGQREDRERSMAAGFDDHLVKPITIDALAKIFRS